MTTTRTTPTTTTPTATVRSVKEWKAREGLGWQATLLVDGVPVAQVTEDGNGGPLRWEVADADRLRPWATAHGVTLGHRGQPPCDSPLDQRMWSLIDAHANDRRLRRYCKTHLCFTTPGTGPDQYFRVKAADTPANRAAVLARHPQAVFLNDQVR